MSSSARAGGPDYKVTLRIEQKRPAELDLDLDF
jgi:hypothetical protein